MYESITKVGSDIVKAMTLMAWHSTQNERVVEDGKRSAQREVSKDIRQEVADWRKAVGYSEQKHGKVIPFEQFAERELDRSGRET